MALLADPGTLGRYDRRMQYLTVPEAAEMARCTPTTLRRWIRERGLRSFKPGRHRLVRTDELQRFLEQNESPMAAPAGREGSGKEAETAPTLWDRADAMQRSLHPGEAPKTRQPQPRALKFPEASSTGEGQPPLTSKPNAESERRGY